MFWPDFTDRPHGKPRWGCVLLLDLAVGIVGAVLVNGWWRILSRRAGPTEPPAVAPVTPGAAGATASARVGDTEALDQPAPAFSLPDLFDGEQAHTLEDYRGRPNILNFWATWCVPCCREMPALQEPSARYEEDGVLFLGMNQT